MMRAFKKGDRVVDCDCEPDRIGTVVNPWPKKRTMEVRFDTQPENEYTIVGKNYMTFSHHPLDRLINGV